MRRMTRGVRANTELLLRSVFIRPSSKLKGTSPWVSLLIVASACSSSALILLLLDLNEVSALVALLLAGLGALLFSVVAVGFTFFDDS